MILEDLKKEPRNKSKPENKQKQPRYFQNDPLPDGEPSDKGVV